LETTTKRANSNTPIPANRRARKVPGSRDLD
jgi:hypothetical protein